MPNTPVVSAAMQKELSFREELAQLLNRHSREHASGTPDFILANHLARCLDSFDQTMIEREKWYGRPIKNVETVND